MTAAAGWISLALTTAICILGLRLASTGYSDLSGALLEAEKRAAEGERARLEGFLDAEEARVLEAIAEAADDPAALRVIVLENPFVAEPYLFTSDGIAVAPLSRNARSVPPILEDPPLHPEVERALRLAAGAAPLEEKIAALDEAARAAPPESRLRAEAAAAGLLARAGDPARALERYDAIARDPAGALREGFRPSRLQLSIARGECLLRAGRPEDAARAVAEALDSLRGDPPAGGLDEERFLAARAGRICDGAGIPRPALLVEIERSNQEKLDAHAFVDSLADWVFARRRLEPAGPELGKPRHFVEERRAHPPGASGARGPSGAGLPLVAVWARLAPPPSGPGLLAAGYLADLADLEAILTREMRGASAGPGLTARLLPARGDFLELAALGGERSYIRLGLERGAWDELVGKARQPFVLAKALVGFLGLAAILGFITFFRGLRREVALSRMKTEFVANVSHELKTPLSLIRLFGETLLLDRVADPVQRKDYLRIITRESERLTHLIANVLDFATIEAGKKTYKLEPRDLGQVARETYECYRFQLDAKGFAHSFSAPDSLPRVLLDADAVAQALINLIENAIKYSPERKELAIRLETAEGRVRIAVEDRGMGISAEDRERIWEDFYRSRAARALGTRGSGLGLSLVRHIVEAHRGRVEMVSAQGEGSRFTLEFPAVEENEMEAR